jgi:polyhydroxyalkanoate synthesis repressor PhaR
MAERKTSEARLAVQPGEGQPALPPVVIKKYANRRLYNTEASSYVTLEDLAAMVREGRDFVVYDAKSGDDITRGVLTQIIVEEESKGRHMLPTSFLRTLIGYYGDSLQSLVPRYLDFAMGSFTRQQEQMRRAMETTMGGFLPFPGLEEMGKQNMAMMERALSLFAPFGGAAGRPAAEAARNGPESQSLEALKAEVEALKHQLEALRGGG